MRDLQEIFEHWQAGDKLRAMERNLGVARHTLRKYLDAAAAAGIHQETPMTPEAWDAWIRTTFPATWGGQLTAKQQALIPHRAWIETALQTNHVTTVWQRLQDQTGLDVSLATFRRYCATLAVPPQARDVTVWRPEVDPGMEAQVDFGKMGRWVDPQTHKTVVVWAFVMTLRYSRHQFVYWVVKQDLATWCRAHMAAFTFWGGVPHRIILDNLKDGVLKPDLYDPALNRTYRGLAEHYGFLIDPGRVAHPKDKPVVERQMQFVRDSAWTGQDWPDLSAAQGGAERWCRTVAGQRIHGTTGRRPYDVFLTEEQGQLHPLPRQGWEFGRWTTAKVASDSHIMVERALYSVPWRYLHQTVDVWVSDREIRVYVGLDRIKTHRRGHARERVTDAGDLPSEQIAFYQRTPQWCREQAAALGSDVAAVVTELLTVDTLGHLRSAQGVIRLADTYGAVRLNAACRRARFFGDGRYQTVKGILRKALDADPLPETPTGGKPLPHTHLRGPEAFRS